jgi:hypothetical protein
MKTSNGACGQSLLGKAETSRDWLEGRGGGWRVCRVECCNKEAISVLPHSSERKVNSRCWGGARAVSCIVEQRAVAVDEFLRERREQRAVVRIL